jgi:tetratricopeptide (TPR) repeat protein
MSDVPLPKRTLKSGISACLIVRNEARFIGECLRSLAGIVDEIIIIDTGSTDDTLAIAEQFPVSIGHFRWVDDFSAARNHALAQAIHEWILYIDADERLIVHDSEEWRACLADPSKAGWRLRLHPKINWTAYAEMRIFRNDPRVRFQGEIHERVHDDISRLCASDGLSVGDCEITLLHVGYEDDQRPKLPRNMPLLQSYLARDPSRMFCWWHLGEQYRLAGDLTAAMQAWQSGIEAVRAQPPGVTALYDSLPFFSLITARAKAGLNADALLDEAIARFPSHLCLQWLDAKRALEKGRVMQARETFARLAAIDGANFFDPDLAYDRALFTHLAQESLALAAFRMGDFAAAAAHYRQASLTAPDPAPLAIKAALATAKASVSTEQPHAELAAITLK